MTKFLKYLELQRNTYCLRTKEWLWYASCINTGANDMSHRDISLMISLA